MAFKLPFTAECDDCGKQICCHAHSEDEANLIYRNKGWYAYLNNHKCPDCKEQLKNV